MDNHCVEVTDVVVQGVERMILGTETPGWRVTVREADGNRCRFTAENDDSDGRRYFPVGSSARLHTWHGRCELLVGAKHTVRGPSLRNQVWVFLTACALLLWIWVPVALLAEWRRWPRRLASVLVIAGGVLGFWLL